MASRVAYWRARQLAMEMIMRRAGVPYRDAVVPRPRYEVGEGVCGARVSVQSAGVALVGDRSYLRPYVGPTVAVGD